MSFCLAYMTFNHKDEAKNIACELLEKKLVSCVNIFPKIDVPLLAGPVIITTFFKYLILCIVIFLII